jgi:hypothetical protein
MNTNENLLKEIEKKRMRLMKKLDDVKDIVSDAYTDILYYAVITTIMGFFVYIILTDIHKTLNMHYIQKDETKGETVAKKKKNDPIYADNYIYTTDNPFITQNNNQYIKNELRKRNTKLEYSLDKLNNFKKENNIDDTIYNSIDIKNVSAVHDNYEYVKNKRETSFWDMLFQKPKHYGMVNNSQGGFWELI